MICTIKTGGTGIEFSVAKSCIFFELEWNVSNFI